MTLVWEDKAKESARAVYGYPYEGSVKYADSWADEVNKELKQLVAFPEMGRIRIQCVFYTGSICRAISASLYISERHNNNSNCTLYVAAPR